MNDSLTISANVFEAVADPIRRSVVDRLAIGPASVSELVTISEVDLLLIARHVNVLTNCGLIKEKKFGRVRTCILNKKELSSIVETLIILEDSKLTLPKKTVDRQKCAINAQELAKIKKWIVKRRTEWEYKIVTSIKMSRKVKRARKKIRI
jgi:DNA-binding transcriptional ArsR family regulator